MGRLELEKVGNSQGGHNFKKIISYQITLHFHQCKLKMKGDPIMTLNFP